MTDACGSNWVSLFPRPDGVAIRASPRRERNLSELAKAGTVSRDLMSLVRGTPRTRPQAMRRAIFLLLIPLALSCAPASTTTPTASPTPPSSLRSLAQARGIGIGAAVGPEPLPREPLLLDESYRPKPAYYAIMDALAAR